MANKKAMLISINKPHTDNIFSYIKGLEWRKKPLPEGLYYVYETKNKGGCGMVIGEMRITGSLAVDTSGPMEVCLVNSGCVHPATLKNYANNGIVYANFIQGIRRYDVPKPLSEFVVEDKSPCDNRERVYQNPDFNPTGGLIFGGNYCRKNGDWCKRCKTKPLTRPPQSWCYVEG